MKISRGPALAVALMMAFVVIPGPVTVPLRTVLTPAVAHAAAAGFGAGGIMFSTNAGGDPLNVQDLYTIGVDGTSLQPYPSAQGNYPGTWSAWSNDGQWLAFSDDVGNLYVSQSESGTFTRIGDTYNGANFGWSPDGTKLAAYSTGAPTDVGYYQRNADGAWSSFQTVYSATFGESCSPFEIGGDILGVSFLDNTHMLFGVAINRGAPCAGIYEVSTTGGTPTQIVQCSSGCWNAVASPDGTKIAYLGLDADGYENGIYITGSGGGSGSEIAGTNGAVSVNWSPDSTELVYGKAGQVYVVPAAGGAPTEVTSGSPESGWFNQVPSFVPGCPAATTSQTHAAGSNGASTSVRLGHPGTNSVTVHASGCKLAMDVAISPDVTISSGMTWSKGFGAEFQDGSGDIGACLTGCLRLDITTRDVRTGAIKPALVSASAPTITGAAVVSKNQGGGYFCNVKNGSSGCSNPFIDVSSGVKYLVYRLPAVSSPIVIPVKIEADLPKCSASDCAHVETTINVTLTPHKIYQKSFPAAPLYSDGASKWFRVTRPILTKALPSFAIPKTLDALLKLLPKFVTDLGGLGVLLYIETNDATNALILSDLSHVAKTGVWTGKATLADTLLNLIPDGTYYLGHSFQTAVFRGENDYFHDPSSSPTDTIAVSAYEESYQAYTSPDGAPATTYELRIEVKATSASGATIVDDNMDITRGYDATAWVPSQCTSFARCLDQESPH
jgi:hypothetical protein